MAWNSDCSIQGSTLARSQCKWAQSRPVAADQRTYALKLLMRRHWRLATSAFVWRSIISGSQTSNNSAGTQGVIAPASTPSHHRRHRERAALWTTGTNIQSSALTQTVRGYGKNRIGTTTPATMLDIKGAETIRGALNLPAAAAPPPQSAQTRSREPRGVVL